MKFVGLLFGQAKGSGSHATIIRHLSGEAISYELQIGENVTPQVAPDVCFIGGRPRMPADIPIPTCFFCKAEQTFFFQVALPGDHAWAGQSLAVFACISCYHERYGTPNQVKRVLDGFDIPVGYFDGYDTHGLEGYALNYRFLVFPTQSGVLREDYREKVRFKRWILKPTHCVAGPGNRIGGKPCWIHNAEAPGTYKRSILMVFLMQIEEGFQYEIVPGAPHQIKFDYPRGMPQPSPEPYYTLFVDDALYLFGTDDFGTDDNEHLVYAIVQSN